jgi:hypothetical protein
MMLKLSIEYYLGNIAADRLLKRQAGFARRKKGRKTYISIR